MPPLTRRRPAARRIAGALFELGGEALARGVGRVTGRGASAPTIKPPPDSGPAVGAGPTTGTRPGPGGRPCGRREAGGRCGNVDARPAADAQAARRAAAAEEAAARLDAARERLRATIVPPADEDDPTAPA